jgi:DNA-binding transcriptional MerR regulator
VADPDLSPEPAEIPDKLYFRIGEVTEFPAVGPKKSDTGHRMYRRKEVELLLRIKYLLYEKKYTIEGARQYLQSESIIGKQKRPVKGEQRDLFSTDAVLPEIRKELMAILELLKKKHH